jgi:hypothetical protein
MQNHQTSAGYFLLIIPTFVFCTGVTLLGLGVVNLTHPIHLPLPNLTAKTTPKPTPKPLVKVVERVQIVEKVVEKPVLVNDTEAFKGAVPGFCLVLTFCAGFLWVAKNG